ncbi:hypothetical protein FOA52_012218 [Chlamydomonas sp. UWO 241]|nr:hypothetical protein FOA52_012218 [Chlamydomonas sp. UWO 241]
MENVKRSRKVGKAATLPQAPAFSWGKSPQRPSSDPDKNPGPGEYQPLDAGLSRGAGFGSSLRPSMVDNVNPSPLDYKLGTKTLKSAPAYTFRTKAVPEHLKSKTPGPGAYEPRVFASSTKPRAPAISLQFRNAPAPDAEKVPAPSAYDPKYQPKDAHAASMKYRHDMAPTDPGPGPLEYSDRVFRYTPSTQGRTFGTSRDDRRLSSTTPGPIYQPDITSVRASHGGGKIPKAASRPDPNTNVPGPGTYYTVQVYDRDAGHGVQSDSRSAPAASIATRPYVSPISESPGPLDYGLPKDPQAKSAPAFSFRGVQPIDYLKSNPGPGAYEPDKAMKLVRASAPSITVAFKPEDPALKELKPAPNEYSPRSESRSGPVIKTRKGWEGAGKDRGPSPAEYDIATIFCPPGSRKGYTFGLKPKARGVEEGPGPIYQVGCSTLGTAAAESLTPMEMRAVAVL